MTTTVTLADLMTPTPASVWRDTLFGFLTASDFPVTSWEDTDGGRGLVEMEADACADLSALVPLIAAGGYLDYAEGDWLVLLAASVYDEAPKGKVVTVGSELLANSTGSPITVAPYDLTFESKSGLTYQNTTGGTVAAGGTLSVTIAATSPGAAYNVGVNEITTLLTPRPGLSASNPAVGSTGTWIATQGVDAESDDSLRARCRAKWGALGSGGNLDAWIYWALSSSPEVTRVAIQENTPSDGNVTTLVAGPAGAIVDSTTMALIDAYMQLRRPLCVRAFTVSATSVEVRNLGSVRVRASQLAAAQSAVATNLQSLFESLDIGALVTVSDRVKAVATAPGVIEVVLVDGGGNPLRLGSGDVTLGPTQVATYTNELTWVTV